MFSQSSFNFVSNALNLPDLIFLQSDNFGSSCSLFLCVHIRDRASRLVKPVTGNGAVSGRDCEKRLIARSNVAT